MVIVFVSMKKGR